MMLIVNDLHIGFNRKSGTTPSTQEALRRCLFQSLGTLLETTEETHLLVLGDLFDNFTVPSRDLIETYSLLAAWLQSGKKLTLVAGNHDHSHRALQVSSFEVLAHIIRSQYPDNATIVAIDEVLEVEPGVVAIAHCSNQDVFNDRLLKVAELTPIPRFLLLHANYDNKFTEHSDHSLNVSVEQAKAFGERGTTLIFAHEHQARTPRKNVYVMGNQWPTSIADCLNNPGGEKHYHVMHDLKLTSHTSWTVDGALGYAEVDWRNLDSVPDSAFVRVVGDATSAEAGDVITKIAALRRTSNAFIVSNAVRIDGIVEAEDLPATFEVAKKFDVLDYVRKHLEADEMVVVEELIREEA